MEPIPVYFQLVHRSALVVKPRQPFFNWLKSIDPEENTDELSSESSVYLIQLFDEKEQIENWLKRSFGDLFEDQLNGWYTDESMWPQKRTLKMFKEWFDYSVHTMVWDTEEESIEKT
jgi:hypothetical protein